MHDVSVEHLHVLDLELGNTVNSDAALIILLPSAFRVESGFVKNDAKRCVRGDVRGGGRESLLVVERLDRRVDRAGT